MAGLNQLLTCSCVLFSVATLTTAVPFDRQLGLSSSTYTNKNVTLDSENVCMIDDVLYQDGDAIPTASPCEKCVCRPPGFACSIITCEKRPNCRALQRSNQCCPEYKCDCEHEGKVYHNGQRLDNSLNPCKVCYCQGGEIACTVIECYKRDDCVPRHVPGMCCPKYDNCPPRDPAQSASNSVRPANATAAREAPQTRDVADQRLNLLGEPGATSQPPSGKPISNSIDDLPQGDDPQVAYDAYDDGANSTSTTSIFFYDDGINSTTTLDYDGRGATGDAETSSPWTDVPTFPSNWSTYTPDWSSDDSAPSTTPSTSTVSGGSTEYIPTMPDDWYNNTTTDYTTEASSESSDGASSAPGSTNIPTSSASESPSVSETSPSTFSTTTTDFSVSDDATEGSSTKYPTTYSDKNFTNLAIPEGTSKPDVWGIIIEMMPTFKPIGTLFGSGDEPDARTSNCIDGGEDCDQSSGELLGDLGETNTTSNGTDGTTAGPDTEPSATVDGDGDGEDNATVAGDEGEAQGSEHGEASMQEGTGDEGSSHPYADIMPGDIALSDQERLEEGSTGEWSGVEESTTQDSSPVVAAGARILPGVLALKGNDTVEGASVVGSSESEDSGATTEDVIPKEWLKTEVTTTSGDDAEGTGTTPADDAGSTASTEDTSNSAEADGSEAGAYTSTDRGHSSEADATVADDGSSTLGPEASDQSTEKGETTTSETSS